MHNRNHKSDRQARRVGLLDVAGLAVFILVLAVLTLRLAAHRPTGDQVDPGQWALASFRDVVYYPARALGDGVNPYDSIRDDAPDRYMNRYPVADHLPLYSPLLLFLYAPLAGLPVNAAMICFAALNVAMLVALSWYTVRIMPWPPRLGNVFGIATLVLLSQPGRAVFNSGQIAPLLALAMLAALNWGRERPRASALAGGLATLKPTVGVPLALLMFANRQFRSGLGALLTGGLAFAAGLIVVFAMSGDLSWSGVRGIVQGNVEYFQRDISTAAVTRAYETEAADPTARATARSFRIDTGAAVEYIVGGQLPTWLSLTLAIMILLPTMIVMWVVGGEPRAIAADTPSSATMIVATFICYYHGVYDILILVVPLAACLTSRQAAWQAISRRSRWILAGLLTVPFVNVFWTEGWWRVVERLLGAAVVESELAETWHAGAAAADGIALTVAWLLLLWMIWTARRPQVLS